MRCYILSDRLIVYNVIRLNDSLIYASPRNFRDSGMEQSKKDRSPNYFDIMFLCFKIFVNLKMEESVVNQINHY